jgi:ATP-binding cassette subfamily B protein
VAAGLDAPAGDTILVVAAGSRLSQYLAATVGEIGFLRGIWMDSSRRLAWLEDYAAAQLMNADQAVPARLTDGLRFDHVSFRYPGTERLVLDDVDLVLPAGRVIAIVGENGAGKSTLVKLIARSYEPTSGHITADLWRHRRTAGA